MKKMMILGFSFFFSGCSLFLPVSTPIHQHYMLEQLPSVSPHFSRHPKILMIMFPQTNPAYDTNQIAYASQKWQINYFSKNAWAMKPADMFYILMIQTLQQSKHFRAVIGPAFVGHQDVILNTWIMELREDTTQPLPTFNISLQAVLTDATTNQIIATKNFHEEIPLSNSSVQSAVNAANQAVAIILRKLSQFCVTKI